MLILQMFTNFLHNVRDVTNMDIDKAVDAKEIQSIDGVLRVRVI